jgi:hypothetical protein
MAVTNFIPEIWSAYILERYVAQNVFPALLDRKYEGDATAGNTVHIPGVVAPAVKDYKQNSRTTSADAISDTGVNILIDQEKNFHFFVDDIDAAQANTELLPLYTDAAGDALAADADQYIAELLFDEGDALDWTGGTVDDGDDAFNVIKAARTQMQKANVPNDGMRVAVVNAEFEGLLLGADSKLTSYDTSGDTQGLRNATVGNLLGFRVVSSNHLPVNDTPAAVFFHQRAAAFISQVEKVEGYRSHTRFADEVRGLHVYGSKVIKPAGVIVFGDAS